MKWRRSPPELVATFESVMPGPPAVRRTMFGYPAGFVKGRLFMGLHQERLVLRLPAESRQRLLATPGAQAFEPVPGRPMREWVAVPPSVLARRAALTRWVRAAFAYTASLAPKPGPRSGPRRAPAAGARRRRR
jgi:hypothetical protein